MMAGPEEWLEKMSVQSEFLQDSWCQVVESTNENSLTSSSRLFDQQIAAVPKSGAALEKSSWGTAILIGLSLVSLLMTTACSGSLNDRAGQGGPPSEIQFSTDTTDAGGDPRSAGSLPFSSESDQNSSSSGNESNGAESNGGRTTDGASSLDANEFSERLRVVSGWLKFVRQEKVAQLIAHNVARENSGEKLPSVNPAHLNAEVKSLIDASTINWSEFKRWRQLIAVPAAAGTFPYAKSVDVTAFDAKSLDSAALLLTIAASPDELMNIDQLLVQPNLQLSVQPNLQLSVESTAGAGY